MRLLKNVILLLICIYSQLSFADKLAPGIYTEDKLNIMVNKEQPEFMIRLKANPTTGYNWFLREYDDKLIRPVKHKYEAPDTKLIGAPGYDVWTFRVTPAGFTVPQMTHLHFIYARPWESQDQGKTLVFKISTQ